MYIIIGYAVLSQACRSCSPPKEYLRLFDVTERTGVRKHQTGRHCKSCGQELRDSIVHFGERSPGLESPYNWEEAAQAADQADLILCIGSSLKVDRLRTLIYMGYRPNRIENLKHLYINFAQLNCFCVKIHQMYYIKVTVHTNFYFSLVSQCKPISFGKWLLQKSYDVIQDYDILITLGLCYIWSC